MDRADGKSHVWGPSPRQDHANVQSLVKVIIKIQLTIFSKRFLLQTSNNNDFSPSEVSITV